MAKFRLELVAIAVRQASLNKVVCVSQLSLLSPEVEVFGNFFAFICCGGWLTLLLKEDNELVLIN